MELSAQTSASPVITAITATIAKLQAPFQHFDCHPAVSRLKSELLKWKMEGTTFFDSMDFAVGEQLEFVDDAYRVLGWQVAVKETVRLINKVASTSKHPQVPGAILCAVRRANKVSSKDLTIDNSLTLSSQHSKSSRIMQTCYSVV